MSEYNTPQQTLFERASELRQNLVDAIDGRKMELGAMFGMGLSLVAADETIAATRASQVPQPTTIDNIYTRANPQTALHTVSESAAPNQGLAVSSFNLLPGSFQAQGDCAAGSQFSIWSDTAPTLDKSSCATGVSESIAQNLDPASPRFEDDLETVAYEQINAMAGFSREVNQPVLSSTGSGEATTTTLACPDPAAKTIQPGIASVTTQSGGAAKVEFCPSDKKVIMSEVNTASSAFKRAFAEYVNDPVRTTEWGGSSIRKNLYMMCPRSARESDPHTKLKYNKARGTLSIAYDGNVHNTYCDEVGENTIEIKAEAKSRKSGIKKLGPITTHVSGLKETLVFGYDYPEKFNRNKVIMRGIGNLCTLGKGATVRVYLTERFIANSKQTFIGSTTGYTTRMKSASRTYRTAKKLAC